MKKIVLSLALIVAVAAVAGMATMAGWSDSDTSNDNKITAGSMTLEWAQPWGDGSCPGASSDRWKESADDIATLPVDAVNAYPGQTETTRVCVRNAGGTVDGTFTVENMSYTEGNGYGDGKNLDEFMDVTFQVDGAGGETRLASLAKTSWDFGGVTLLSDGTPEALDITWEFVDGDPYTSSVDINTTMGDSVMIDFDGVLTQKK